MIWNVNYKKIEQFLSEKKIAVLFVEDILKTSRVTWINDQFDTNARNLEYEYQ